MDFMSLLALLGPEGVPGLAGVGGTATASPVVPPIDFAGGAEGMGRMGTGVPVAQDAYMGNYMTPGVGAPSAAPPPGVPMPMSRLTSLGAALEPSATGNPTGHAVNPWSSKGTLGSGPASASGASAAAGSDALLKTLRGVKAPEAPTPQKVGTPSLPALKPIQGGAYFDLLASLGIGPQQALPGLKLPSTLGQALGGR